MHTIQQRLEVYHKYSNYITKTQTIPQILELYNKYANNTTETQTIPQRSKLHCGDKVYHKDTNFTAKRNLYYNDAETLEDYK